MSREREIEAALEELTERVEGSWPVLRDPARSRYAAAMEGNKLRHAAEKARTILVSKKAGGRP